MATITPTLTLTSNASTATTPGPLSVALSLSATDSLTVDTVTAATLVTTATVQTLFDGSALDIGSEVAGLNGGFLYLKNVSPSEHDIYIGVEADGATATELGGNADAQRLFTLKQNEFAFFPYDYTMDITVDGEHATSTLEYFLFNRANA
jgi:hypothetical protein